MQILQEIITDADIADVMDAVELQEVRPASDWVGQFGGDDAAQGRLLPWSKAHGGFDLRPGEVTLWGGENSSGKSGALGQVIAWQQTHCRAMIASMEMLPTKTLRRMGNQIYGGQAPVAFLDAYAEWTGKGTESRFFVYDQNGMVPAKKLLAVTQLAAQRLRLHDIVIDSLMMCGVAGRDEKYNAQIDFVRGLCDIARLTGVHLHLVCHIRKQQDSYAAPNKWDILGPSEITNMCDNLVLMWRNKAKEDAENEGKLTEVTAKEHDVYLKVAKQRHFPWERTIGLFYNKQSGQLTQSPDRVTMRWPSPVQKLPFEWRDSGMPMTSDHDFEEF